MGAMAGGDGQVHTANCQDSQGTATNATFHDCSGGAVTLVGLRNGRHIFTVKAIDNAGNVGVPTQFGWNVDLAAPTAALKSGTSARPPVLTNRDTAQFLVEADESIVTFECRVLCAERNPTLYLSEMDAGTCSCCVWGYMGEALFLRYT